MEIVTDSVLGKWAKDGIMIKAMKRNLRNHDILCFCPQPDPEDFIEEQWLMGRLVHLFQASSLDQQYMVS